MRRGCGGSGDRNPSPESWGVSYIAIRGMACLRQRPLCRSCCKSLPYFVQFLFFWLLALGRFLTAGESVTGKLPTRRGNKSLSRGNFRLVLAMAKAGLGSDCLEITLGWVDCCYPGHDSHPALPRFGYRSLEGLRPLVYEVDAWGAEWLRVKV